VAPWAPKADKTINELNTKLTKVTEEFKVVLKLYDEPQTTKSEDFFGILSNFATTVEQSIIGNEKRRAAEREEEKKKANAANKLATSTGGTPKKVVGRAGGPATGELDALITQMKSGAAFLERKSTIRSLREEKEKSKETLPALNANGAPSQPVNVARVLLRKHQ